MFIEKMINSIPNGKRPRVHVIYEHGLALRPYSSPFLRLLRPFSHPLIQAHIDATFGLDYDNEPVDLVVIDRLWRRDVSLQLAQELVNKIRLKGAKVIYSLDDNYFDLPFDKNPWPTRETLPIVTFLLRQADAVLVTTPALRQCLLDYNPNIHVLPNQLDERLLVLHHPSNFSLQIDQNRIVVGYMGTFTHDEDLMMILPALKSIHRRFPGQIEVQIIGVMNNEQTKQELQALPIRYVYPRPEEHEYPLFMLWFTGHVHWDIAISPLQNNKFNTCKSDIKFLDYASIGAAGIYSQSPVYSSTVQPQENGCIVENTENAWEEALETLIRDNQLRLKFAQNAIHYLYRERILAQHASDWVETIKSLC